jgi:hypothetical protein
VLKTHVVLDDEDEGLEERAEEVEPESKVESEVPSQENQKMEEGNAKSENMISSSGSDILQNIE